MVCFRDFFNSLFLKIRIYVHQNEPRQWNHLSNLVTCRLWVALGSFWKQTGGLHRNPGNSSYKTEVWDGPCKSRIYTRLQISPFRAPYAHCLILPYCNILPYYSPHNSIPVIFKFSKFWAQSQWITLKRAHNSFLEKEKLILNFWWDAFMSLLFSFSPWCENYHAQLTESKSQLRNLCKTSRNRTCGKRMLGNCFPAIKCCSIN